MYTDFDLWFGTVGIMLVVATLASAFLYACYAFVVDGTGYLQDANDWGLFFLSTVCSAMIAFVIVAPVLFFMQLYWESTLILLVFLGLVWALRGLVRLKKDLTQHKLDKGAH